MFRINLMYFKVDADTRSANKKRTISNENITIGWSRNGILRFTPIDRGKDRGRIKTTQSIDSGSLWPKETKNEVTVKWFTYRWRFVLLDSLNLLTFNVTSGYRPKDKRGPLLVANRRKYEHKLVKKATKDKLNNDTVLYCSSMSLLDYTRNFRYF